MSQQKLIITLLILSHLSMLNSQSIFNSYLTPQSPSSNNAIINILKDTTTNTNTWSIHPQDQIGFHLSLNLPSSTWQPSHNQTTKYILQLNSNTAINNNTPNLIVSFANSPSKYITTIISISQEEDNMIYPNCNENTAQSWATGNIQQLVNTSNSKTRAQKATNSVSSSTFILSTSTHTPTTEYPLTFILTNNPSTNSTTFTYKNNDVNVRSCIFSEIDGHEDITVYLGVSQTNSTLNLTSFNITKIIEPSLFNFRSTTMEEDDDDYKWYTDPEIVRWEVISIAVLAVCYCICCIFFLCKFRKKRRQKENDKKLAYALQMAGTSPSFETGSQYDTDKSHKTNKKPKNTHGGGGGVQAKSDVIAIPKQNKIRKGVSKDNLVVASGPSDVPRKESMISLDKGNGDHVIKTRGMTNELTPEPPSPPIKHAAADYEPTGDSFAPSPPLPPVDQNAFHD